MDNSPKQSPNDPNQQPTIMAFWASSSGLDVQHKEPVVPAVNVPHGLGPTESRMLGLIREIEKNQQELYSLKNKLDKSKEALWSLYGPLYEYDDFYVEPEYLPKNFDPYASLTDNERRQDDSIKEFKPSSPPAPIIGSKRPAGQLHKSAKRRKDRKAPKGFRADTPADDDSSADDLSKDAFDEVVAQATEYAAKIKAEYAARKEAGDAARKIADDAARAAFDDAVKKAAEYAAKKAANDAAAK
ncbi:hypothetical protein PG994_008433 [Apiospora phragmitis]|uniref:Uncharacterized protein n=1 Tax=Apiospora phragmitis TaxID=2905665 RepID=A0ABR1UGE7_9PEZI